MSDQPTSNDSFDDAPAVGVAAGSVMPAFDLPPPVQAAPVVADDDGLESPSGGSGRGHVAFVRRVAKLTLAFSAAPADVLRVAAAAAGVRGEVDAVSLVVQVASGETRAARATLSQMVSADVSTVPSAIMVVGRLVKDREMMSRWWRVAAAVGLVSGDMARDSTTAASALVAGLAGRDESAKAVLASAEELLVWRR